jgi:hypothetical protein
MQPEATHRDQLLELDPKAAAAKDWRAPHPRTVDRWAREGRIVARPSPPRGGSRRRWRVTLRFDPGWERWEILERVTVTTVAA